MKLLTHLCTILLLLAIISCEKNNDPEVDNSSMIVGAIRWDAWHKAVDYSVHGIHGGPVKAMERSLSPEKYHFRAPFFSTIISDTEIQIEGYTQEIIDQEIEFAFESGLDYWAFLLYGENDVMTEGLNFYLSSQIKDKIKFCAVENPNLLFANSSAERARLIKLINESNYQMVLGNRPLIYIYGLSQSWMDGYSTKDIIDALRDDIISAGFGDPYIVIMHDNEELAKNMMIAMGANAISKYAIWGNGGFDGATYSNLTTSAVIEWKAALRQGVEVVPTVTSGWNRSPRIDNPVPWEPYQLPGANADKIFALPTASELASHLQEGINWVKDNKTTCPAELILIYAWNEHDEGGWLCPTITVNGEYDNSRLEAMKTILSIGK